MQTLLHSITSKRCRCDKASQVHNIFTFIYILVHTIVGRYSYVHTYVCMSRELQVACHQSWLQAYGKWQWQYAAIMGSLQHMYDKINTCIHTDIQTYIRTYLHIFKHICLLAHTYICICIRLPLLCLPHCYCCCSCCCCCFKLLSKTAIAYSASWAIPSYNTPRRPSSHPI